MKPEKQYHWRIFQQLCALNLTVLCISALLFLPAYAQPQSPASSYSRALSDPFTKYSYENVQKMASAIRAQGHAIPTGHPRLFISAANRNALRQRIAAHYVDRMQQVVDIADANFGVTITDPGKHSKEPPGQPVVLANALIYQIGLISGVNYGHSIAEYGAEGVRHLLDLIAIDPEFTHIEYLAMPLGYDWLFPLMSDSQRQVVATTLLEYAQPNNDHIEPYNNPPGARLLGALAVYGDSQYVAQSTVSALLALFHNGLVFGDPADMDINLESGRNFSATQIFTPEGPGVEGLGYSGWYGPFYPILLAWRDQTGEDYFKLPFFQNWVLHFTHLTGNQYQFQDKYWHVKNKPWATHFNDVNTWLELGLEPSNREAASLAKYHHGGTNHVRDSVRMLYLVMSDPTLQALSPADLNLPTTAHFEGSNNVLARNGWTGVDAAWVWFQSPIWTSVRDLGPVNDLLIWKNGAMLLGKHVQSHDYDGGNRTNTIVLYDQAQPGHTFIPHNVMDRAWNRPLGLRLDQGDSLQDLTRDLVGYEPGLRYFEDRASKYVYALGDAGPTMLQDAIDGQPSAPLKSWIRHFLWFRNSDNSQSDVFLVLDRVAKERDTLIEHIPWHYATDPEIRDRAANSSLGTGQQQVKGIWKYEEANRIVTTNTVQTDWGTAHARLFTDTLLPKNPIYYRMGGIAERNIDLFGNLLSDRLDVSGSPDDPENIVQGLYRVQVTAPQQAKTQLYLHVLQATDSSVNQVLTPRLLEGQNVVGAKIGDDVAILGSAGEEIVSGALANPLPIDGTVKRLFIAGLVPFANYDIQLGAVSLNRESSEAGVIYLENIVLKPDSHVVITQDGAPNLPPLVDLGLDTSVVFGTVFQLQPSVADDGQPNPPGKLTFSWQKIAGPGTVTFSDASSATATVSFSMPGSYTLRLTASDGARSSSDEIELTVVENSTKPAAPKNLRVVGHG